MRESVAKEYSYSGQYESSVAYDLSRFDNRRRVREALEDEPAVGTHGDRGAASARRTETAEKSEPRARGLRISAFAVLSYAAIFVLVLMIVMNYMRLNEISVTSERRADELAELRNEASLLQVRYEQKQNTTDITERAAELGLYAPTSAQINYVDIRRPDYAVVYDDGKDSNAFVEGLHRIAAAIGKIFE